MRHHRKPEPLALDSLLDPDGRRTISVDAHQHFRESISTDGVDEIDRATEELVEELRRVEIEGRAAR